MIPMAVITFVALVAAGHPPATQYPVHFLAAAPEANETVGLMSEEVARVRLQKLGFQIQQLTRRGDNWDAVVIKDGVTQHIRLDALSGTYEELAPMPAPQRR
jgi:hypothetical protein